MSILLPSLLSFARKVKIYHSRFQVGGPSHIVEHSLFIRCVPSPEKVTQWRVIFIYSPVLRRMTFYIGIYHSLLLLCSVNTWRKIGPQQPNHILAGCVNTQDHHCQWHKYTYKYTHHHQQSDKYSARMQIYAVTFDSANI